MVAASLILSSAFLAGCNTTSGSRPIAVNLAAPSVPDAQPVTMRPVKWKVYNASDLRKLAAANTASKGVVLIALTPKGYQDLSANLVEIERYMREQGEIVVTYKKILKGREQAGTPLTQ
jgi:hypothetical protein